MSSNHCESAEKGQSFYMSTSVHYEVKDIAEPMKAKKTIKKVAK